MTFKDEFLRLLQAKQISIPQLAKSIGISQSTPYFWTKGLSVPGRKTLRIIFEDLQPDEETKKILWSLREAHQRPIQEELQQRRPKDLSIDKFATSFSEIVNNRSLSMYQLSDASKVRRATIYGWMQGKAIPKSDKLLPVLKHLNCSEDKKKELMDLCLKARDANPRPKGYKNRSLWEKDGAERVSILFKEYGLQVSKASSLDYDLEIRPKNSRGTTKHVPVFFKNKTADLNAIFVKGCEVKMKAGSDFVLIIIFDNNPNHNRTLFEYYGIIMVSEKDLFDYTQSILSGLFPNN